MSGEFDRDAVDGVIRVAVLAADFEFFRVKSSPGGPGADRTARAVSAAVRYLLRQGLVTLAPGATSAGLREQADLDRRQAEYERYACGQPGTRL